MKHVPPLDPEELEFLQNPRTASSGRSGNRFTAGRSYCFFFDSETFAIPGSSLMQTARSATAGSTSRGGALGDRRDHFRDVAAMPSAHFFRHLIDLVTV